METELLSWGKVKTTLSPPWNQNKNHGENSWNVFSGVRNQWFLFLHPDTLEGSPCFLDIATWNFRSVGSPQMKLISETSNSQLLAPGCLCLPISMQRKVKSNIKTVRKPICCFCVSNNDLHSIRGQKRQHCPKREWNRHLKLTRALTLQSHFHRNWPAKKQGKALKSVSLKMLELPCLCWSKCCYHRNRRSSRTSSWELLCPSAWPAPAGLQVERATTPRADPSLMAQPLQGKPNWDTPCKRGSLLCFDEKPALKCHGADLNPVRAVAVHQWCRWSLRQSHAQTPSITSFVLVDDGPSGCQLCEGLFIIIPRLVTSSSRVRGKFMLFHFPSPVPSADRDQCYRKHFTESSKEDKLLKLWHPTGQAVSCFVPQKRSLIDASWYLDASVLGKVPLLLTLTMETKRPIAENNILDIILLPTVCGTAA